MSVFSLKSYYPSKTRDFSSSHKKSETFLHSSPSPAYSNLRAKLISLDLTTTKRSHFFDFVQNFKRKNQNNVSNLTIKPSILTRALKGEKGNFSMSNTSKSSMNLAKTLEKTYFSLRKGYHSMAYFEAPTSRKDTNTLDLSAKKELKLTCSDHPEKPADFTLENHRNPEFFCSKCAAKLLNKGEKVQNSALLLDSKLEKLTNDIETILPNMRTQLESLDLKREDIARFYETQMVKIKGFYDELIQKLQSEKIALLHSFFMHKTRTFEIYESFKKEISYEFKDLEQLETQIKEGNFDNIDEIGLNTQEKIHTAKLNIAARNKEFVSIFRTAGLNDKKMESIKKRLLPLFEVVQIPTSILKKNQKKTLENNNFKEKTENFCFSFEGNTNNTSSKNENSSKFKTILEKIKRNQARNSELYMHKDEKSLNLNLRNRWKRTGKAKSMPGYFRKSLEIKINEEPILTLIENFKEKENSDHTSQETFRKKINYSPNFKEML